jgi:uncharacterized repeat protein (TIGR03803 family)
MKTKNLFVYYALIAALNSLPASQVTAQSFITLHSFTTGDGANPYAGVILSGKTLYGTAYAGGNSGGGTVFALATDGTGFTNLHHFNYSDGANPSSGLILSGNTLYGTTYHSLGGGTVFAINTDGTGFTNLLGFTQLSSCFYGCDFDEDCAYCGGVCVAGIFGNYCYRPGSEYGSYPQAGLISSGNTLYGSVSSGGISAYGALLAGAVFAVNTDGTGFTNLHGFTQYDGASPRADLVLSGNTLYGTAYNGGSSGNGTVFAVNTDGTGFRILHTFTAKIIPCLNGSCPPGDWCVGGICVPISGSPCLNNSCPAGYQCVGGICVPMVVGCPGGCPPGHECVCSADRNGNPLGPCYCADRGGGGGGVATPISDGGVTPQSLTSINFDGANPIGGLILSNDTLYGTATTGGSSDLGTVFAVHTDGTGFTILHSFIGGSDGGNPHAGLVLSGNTLYGTASAGGSSGQGTIFAVNMDGTGFTNLYHFTGASDGANPIGGLILSGNTLLGTTADGGGSGKGTVFSLSLPPPVVQCKSVTVSAGADCTADASVDNGSFDPNGGVPLIVVQSPPGPYPLGDTSVTLTAINNLGASNSCVATVSVVDTTPPTIICPSNTVTDATSPAGALVVFAPTASDNCSVASITSSPASGSTFAIGDTSVTCTATDAAGNRAACTFAVHVSGAAEQISNLIALVQRLGLQPGIATGLIVKLQGAASALDSGSIQAACGKLGALLNEVNAQRGKKVPVAQATLLVAEATRVRAVLGCN